MPIYLAPYVGTGKLRVDPFRPYGYDEPGWSSFDLRKDCTKSGKCLVEYKFPNNNYRLRKIAEHGSELEPWVKTLGFEEFHLGNWSWYRNPHQEEFIYEVVARDFLKKKNLRPRLIAALGSALIASILTASGLLDWKEIILLLPPFLTLPATDDFAGTGALSGSWTTQSITMVRNSGVAQCSILTTDCFNYWTGDAFNNNQYSQYTIISASTASGGCYVYIMCRGSGTLGGGTNTMYWSWTDTSASAGECTLQKTVNNTSTQLKDYLTAFALNDVYYIQAVGTNIIVKKNGSQVGTTASDSAITSGSAGIGGFASNANLASAQLDNWEGGNVAASTGARLSTLALLGVGNN
jgi:hypothetical protein